MEDISRTGPAAFPRAILTGTLVLMLSTVMPSLVLSQEIGDAEQGLQYAADVCSECHAILPEQPLSPVAEAPRFEDVANTAGMTATALIAWLQTSHPTMPNIIMTGAEMGDVVEYILSMKNK